MIVPPQLPSIWKVGTSARKNFCDMSALSCCEFCTIHLQVPRRGWAHIHPRCGAQYLLPAPSPVDGRSALQRLELFLLGWCIQISRKHCTYFRKKTNSLWLLIIWQVLDLFNSSKLRYFIIESYLIICEPILVFVLFVSFKEFCHFFIFQK